VDITDSEIARLKEMVTAAKEEFDMAVTYHEVWKPAAYDKDLHSRMGQSYASQAFLVMRMALRRETVLALMRLWDRNKQAVRMSLIVHTIRKSAVIDALAAERAERFNWPGVVEQMRAALQAKAVKVIELTNKYSEGGSHDSVLEDLLRLRDERLAHRQIEPSTVEGANNFDEAIEEFYQDNAKIIQELLSLANATAYDPLDTAEVYQHYAANFWAGVRGEKTEGHPHFRPPALPFPSGP
jgi:AbiU2